MTLKNITIGCDPEMFIIDTANSNSVVSSIGIIPGEKGNAWRAPDMPKGFGIEIDNILAEFNIPPVKDEESFVKNINYMKDYISKFVKKVNPSYDILCTASMHVPEDQLQSPEAKLFGCSVDYNAYTEKVNPKPNGTSTNLRSAGFHIHIGYHNPNSLVSLMLVKALDITLGLPSVLLDKDCERRALYGKAGAFRITPYGLEYRVLSSFMYSTDELIRFIYRGAMEALNAYDKGLYLPSSDNIQKAINNSDSTLAVSLLSDLILDEHENYAYSSPFIQSIDELTKKI